MIVTGLQFRRTLMVAALAQALAVPAWAQVRLHGGGGVGEISAVCTDGASLFLTVTSGDCSGGLNFYGTTALIVGPDSNATYIDAGTGEATFNAATTFNSVVTFYDQTSFRLRASFSAITDTNGIRNTGNIVTATLGTTGNATIGGTLNVAGLTTLGGGLDVPGSASVGFLTGGTIVATNAASAPTLSASSALLVAPGATIDLGGNRVQNVGAPVAPGDAANRGYVDSSVGALGAVAATQATQITAINAVNTMQDGQITVQAGQIGAIQTVNTTQAGQITAIQSVDAAQAGQITVIQSVDAAQAGQITTLQTLTATQSSQIGLLQTGQTILFDLTDINRRDIRKANEGVAMALAMESPALPAGTSFALSGGIGYFQSRAAATTAFTARVGPNASVSAGIGVGFDSGVVGARGGFQVAW